MLRLKQRSGKRLVSVTSSGSKPLRFAESVHSSISSLTLSPRQLFIYNINKITEHSIGKVLSVAYTINPKLGNVLETSDYMNYPGLQLVQPDFASPEAAEFVLGWGCEAAALDKTGFRLEIQQFADLDSQADLLLPGPSYLEIDGTALSNNGGITRFKNPSKSMLISELLRLFYNLGWISPTTADINHWNEEAEKLLKRAPGAPAELYDPAQVDVSTLRDTVIPLDNLLQQRVIVLYEKRKTPTQF